MRTLECTCRRPGHPADGMTYTVFVRTVNNKTEFAVYEHGPWESQPQHARADAERDKRGITFTSRSGQKVHINADTKLPA